MKYHEHKPFEGCVEDCPQPHMTAEQAEDWWERMMGAENYVDMKAIEKEALPRQVKVRPFRSYIGGS